MQKSNSCDIKSSDGGLVWVMIMLLLNLYVINKWIGTKSFGLLLFLSKSAYYTTAYLTCVFMQRHLPIKT